MKRSKDERTERDYAEQVAEHDSWPIGDTTTGTGGLKTTDDVGTGGTSDFAGPRDVGDTAATRTGQVRTGGAEGAPGQAQRGELESLARGPVDRASVDKAEDRVDPELGGGTNTAAVQATSPRPAAELPGTADLGAAAGDDVGAGLGGTRGNERKGPRGQITGVGGTRGTGGGTGHLESGRGG